MVYNRTKIRNKHRDTTVDAYVKKHHAHHITFYLACVRLKNDAMLSL